MKTSFLPKINTIILKEFYPVSVRAEILKIIALIFGRNDVFIKPFRFLLTFRLKSWETVNWFIYFEVGTKLKISSEITPPLSYFKKTYPFSVLIFAGRKWWGQTGIEKFMTAMGQFGMFFLPGEVKVIWKWKKKSNYLQQMETCWCNLTIFYCQLGNWKSS